MKAPRKLTMSGSTYPGDPNKYAPMTHNGSCRSELSSAPSCGDFGYKNTSWSNDYRLNCGFSVFQPTCHLTKWNQDNKRDCCLGILNDNAYCEYDWCPFSSTCTSYMKDVCNQADGKTRLPMDPNYVPKPGDIPDVMSKCSEWCRNNPGACNDIKEKHCFNAKYYAPGYPYPALETEVCKSYCSQVGTNCDTAYQNYCSTLDDPLAHNVCSCFMGDAFYDTYFDEITMRYNFSAAPKYKHCYFGRCATSNIKPYLTKEGKEPCPNVFQCVQVTNVENNGTISGPIEIIQSSQCQQIINEGGLSEKKYSCRSSDEKCVEDSSGGTMSLDQCNKDVVPCRVDPNILVKMGPVRQILREHTEHLPIVNKLVEFPPNTSVTMELVFRMRRELLLLKVHVRLLVFLKNLGGAKIGFGFYS